MPTRMIGLIPIAIGAFTFLAVIATPEGPPPSWMDWAFGPLLVALGAGLLFSQRWAWAVAALAGIAAVVAGAILVAGPGDLAFPGSQVIGFVLYVAPGLALLAALFNRPTLRWFMGRTRSTSVPVPHRPDVETIDQESGSSTSP